MQNLRLLSTIFLKNHPFVDGNESAKASSFFCSHFLELNGYKLKNQHQEEVEFAARVDDQNLTLEEIAAWLKNHSEKLIA